MELSAIRSTGSRRQADDWLVVLASAGIRGRVIRTGYQWMVYVPEDLVRAASANLDAYEKENAARRRPQKTLIDLGPTPMGVATAAVLLALHGVSYLDPGRVFWLQHGRASAWRILGGEWWRTITALTLHADIGHIVANAATSVIFVGAVGRIFGSGLGVLLVLLGGALGNLINAIVRGVPHAAIGASTAVFAAVGILGGAQLVRHRRLGADWRRVWLPIGAALAILAMLGSGAETDFLAHLFGLIAGVGVGTAAATALTEAPKARMQQGSLLLAIALVVGAWALALGR